MATTKQPKKRAPKKTSEKPAKEIPSKISLEDLLKSPQFSMHVKLLIKPYLERPKADPRQKYIRTALDVMHENGILNVDGIIHEYWNIAKRQCTYSRMVRDQIMEIVELALKSAIADLRAEVQELVKGDK